MRKLISGTTYWNEGKSDFDLSSLKKDLETDVLIIGAGMSGTLCAYILGQNKGLRISMVDTKKVAEGSSRANTGLLQVSSDTMLSEFIEKIGEDKARRFYKMCEIAMEDLFKIGEKLPGSTIRKRKSLYCASDEKDVPKIRREYEALKAQGMTVEYLKEKEVLKRYRVNCPGALLIDGDADVDPVAFIKTVTKHNLKEGTDIYPETEIALDTIKENSIETKKGHTITFKYCIFATGYAEKYDLVKEKININRTFAFVTHPVEKELWPEEVMIWETKDPYLYLRTTQDGRIVSGGLDEEKDVLVEDQQYIESKVSELKESIEKIMADPIVLDVDASYNALFGTVKDGLPLIGNDPDRKNHFYILGYEGNGTCYSMAGARIIKNLIEGEEDPYKDIVRLDR